MLEFVYDIGSRGWQFLNWNFILPKLRADIFSQKTSFKHERFYCVRLALHWHTLLNVSFSFGNQTFGGRTEDALEVSLSLSRQRKSKQSLAQISTAKGRVTAATATTFGVDEGQNFDKKAKNEGHKGQKEGPSEWSLHKSGQCWKKRVRDWWERKMVWKEGEREMYNREEE